MKKIVLTVVAMLSLTSSVFAAPTEVDALATQKYLQKKLVLQVK